MYVYIDIYTIQEHQSNQNQMVMQSFPSLQTSNPSTMNVNAWETTPSSLFTNPCPWTLHPFSPPPVHKYIYIYMLFLYWKCEDSNQGLLSKRYTDWLSPHGLYRNVFFFFFIIGKGLYIYDT